MNRRGFLGRLGVAVAAIVGAPAAVRALARLAPAESEVYPVSVLDSMTAMSIHTLNDSASLQWAIDHAPPGAVIHVPNARGVVTAVDPVRRTITVEWGNVEQGNGGLPFPCLDIQFGRSEASTRPFPVSRLRNAPWGRAS